MSPVAQVAEAVRRVGDRPPQVSPPRCGAPIGVLKFGSSVIRSRQDYQRISLAVYRWIREGYRIIAVVSAMGDTTDSLFEQANRVNKNPSPAIVANLVATGEWVSASHLGLWLDKAGIPTRVLDPAGLGINTQGPVLDASCATLDVQPLLDQLETVSVLVVPGYVGMDRERRFTLLGRGGTDLSALFIANQLNAAFCHLIKDVDGLYTGDPAEDPHAQKYGSVSYRDVLALEEGIVQHKAVEFAQSQKMSFEVGCLYGQNHTVVCEEATQLVPKSKPKLATKLFLFGEAPLREALRRILKEYPHEFEVVSEAAYHDQGLPMQKPLDQTLHHVDVFVDLSQVAGTGESLLSRALEAGCNVVSANTALVATAGDDLVKLAASHDCHFLFHTALGGSVPILKALAEARGSGTLWKMEASFAGPSNSLLREIQSSALEKESCDPVNRWKRTGEFERALAGQNDLEKLLICANLGFGLDLRSEEVAIERLDCLDGSWFEKNRSQELVLRYLACVQWGPDGIRASVSPQWLEKNHPIANLDEKASGFLLHYCDGSTQWLYEHHRDFYPMVMGLFADLWSCREMQGAKKTISV